MTDMEPALAGTLEALRRTTCLLDRAESSAGTEPVSPLVLRHLRHCAEHFDCLLEGLPRGVVDYSARRRDAVLESDPVRLRERLAELSGRMAALPLGEEQRALVVRDVMAPGRSAEVRSGLRRELAYLSSHCIHHLALLEGLLPALEGEASHGIAYSTEAAMAEGAAAAGAAAEKER